MHSRLAVCSALQPARQGWLRCLKGASCVIEEMLRFLKRSLAARKGGCASENVLVLIDLKQER